MKELTAKARLKSGQNVTPRSHSQIGRGYFVPAASRPGKIPPRLSPRKKQAYPMARVGLCPADDVSAPLPAGR